MNYKYNIPLYHAITTIKISTYGVNRDFKVIMHQHGLFYPLIDYFLENQFKSLSWQNNLVYIVGLFLDYIIACDQEQTYLENSKKIYFFPDFIKLLHYGTIDINGDSKLGLYWSPKKIYRVNRLVKDLYLFLDWNYNKNNYDKHNILSKSYIKMTLTEKIIHWKHFTHKKYLSILSHIKTFKQTANSSFYLSQKTSIYKSDISDLHAFPNEKIFDLLFLGFKSANNKYDIRNILIIILMHFGGCRLSEPFHIFANDITEDPNIEGKALVRLYHPEDGIVKYYDSYSQKVIITTRKNYLQTKFNLMPRNLAVNTYRAGWKDLALDKTGAENYALIHWFPSWAGNLFWSLYKIYITTILPKNLSHPYLFVSLDQKNYGQPYTINAFRDSYTRAIKKINMDCHKCDGTTPHAHRHAYGQNLEKAQIDPKIIQKALHHKSPLSQMVYTMPDIEAINTSLNKAESEGFCKTHLSFDYTSLPKNKLDQFLEYLKRHHNDNT